MTSVQLFASLLLVAAVAGQDYTYDYYEPEAVVPEPVAAVPEPAPVVVAEPPQNKAVVAKLGSETSDAVCTDMVVQITMSDSSAFANTDTRVIDAVINRADMDAVSIGRTFAITNSDMTQGQTGSAGSAGSVTLTMNGKTEDSSDCGHVFKRVATVAEAQLRVQEAIWNGDLASTATFDTPDDIPTVTDVSFTLGGKMVTEIGAYDHDEDFSVTTCNATTCVTKKVHSHRYDLPIADDDGPINGNAAETGSTAVGCVAYPTTPDSTVINDDGAGTVTGHGCYTSGQYLGHLDGGRTANSGNASESDTSTVYATNIPVGSLDQSWVSSQYRDDDAAAKAAATRASELVVSTWKSRNEAMAGQHFACLDWVAGEWTTIAGRTYATFEDATTADCVLTT